METINYIQDELSHVKAVLIENIEELINRHEKVEDLQEKALELEERSESFRKQTSNLKRKQWWRNNKFRVAAGTISVSTLAYGLFIFL